MAGIRGGLAPSTGRSRGGATKAGRVCEGSEVRSATATSSSQRTHMGACERRGSDRWARRIVGTWGRTAKPSARRLAATGVCTKLPKTTHLATPATRPKELRPSNSRFTRLFRLFDDVCDDRLHSVRPCGEPGKGCPGDPSTGCPRSKKRV